MNNTELVKVAASINAKAKYNDLLNVVRELLDTVRWHNLPSDVEDLLGELLAEYEHVTGEYLSA